MASPYILSNAYLQLLQANLATRFQLYLAFFNPISLTVNSQDVQQDVNGQYTILDSVDLLAQHRAPYAPQPNFGPNRIGFVGEPLFFDGSRSSQRGNIPAVGHIWTVQGVGSYTMQTYDGPYTPGGQASIVFQDPGLYTVSLTVKDRFGGSSTGIRQIMIYQDRLSTPQAAASFTGITGSISGGGYTATLTSVNHLAPIPTPEALPIGQFIPITVIAETFVETTPGSWYPLAQSGPWGIPRPGNYYEDPSILFSGYVVSASAQQTVEQSVATYQLATADALLHRASIHNIGYYHTTYATRDSATGIPTSLKLDGTAGKGQLVADLTSEDVYRSLVLDHSNFSTYHDVHITRDFLPTNPDGTAPAFDSNLTLYQLTYTTLSANEGAIWDAMGTLAKNEFHSLWCERDSSLRIGPQLQLRGYEMLKQPTVYGPLRAKQILNAKTELQRVDALSSQLVNDIDRQNAPVHLLNLFGPNPLPNVYETLSNIKRDVSTLVGPPILCAFSDTPLHDSAIDPPNDPRLFPWIRGGWPQDLAVYPLGIQLAENFIDRTGLVKLVATVTNQQNFWAAWYPTGIFSCNGLMPDVSAAGAWDVQTDLLLADITTASGSAAQLLGWQYLWEMARRVFYAANRHYEVQIATGMFPWARLNDIVTVTRQKAQDDGPTLFMRPMSINSIAITIDTNAQTWHTALTVEELTSATLGPMQSPPCAIPRQ